jgi:hypothetical protein
MYIKIVPDVALAQIVSQTVPPQSLYMATSSRYYSATLGILATVHESQEMISSTQ